MVVPVGTAFDLLYPLAGDLGESFGHRLIAAGRCLVEVAVVEVERLIVVLELRHIGLKEHIEECWSLAESPQLQFSPLAEPPPLELHLIFPLFGIADARFCFDVVPPHVLGTLAVSPDVLAGDAAGVTADALVKIEYHYQLSREVHCLAPSTF